MILEVDWFWLYKLLLTDYFCSAGFSASTVCIHDRKWCVSVVSVVSVYWNTLHAQLCSSPAFHWSGFLDFCLYINQIPSFCVLPPSVVLSVAVLYPSLLCCFDWWTHTLGRSDSLIHVMVPHMRKTWIGSNLERSDFLLASRQCERSRIDFVVPCDWIRHRSKR